MNKVFISEVRCNKKLIPPPPPIRLFLKFSYLIICNIFLNYVLLLFQASEVFYIDDPFYKIIIKNSKEYENIMLLIDAYARSVKLF